MERFRNITIIFLLAVVLPASGATAKLASVLLQEGLYAEETEGNLDAAIKVYERVLKDFPGNRPVAAKALLRIGLCYEKLGKQEAQKAYRRLLKEYTDQPEPLARARARLAALGQTVSPASDVDKTGPVIQELKIEHSAGGFSLSRDGNKLVYCRLKNRKQNLVVRDLISGEDAEITNHVTGHTALPIFSPDGTKIVYTLVEMKKPYTCYLHIVSLQTGEDRRLEHEGFASDWSSDGRYMVVVFSDELNKEDSYSILSITEDKIDKMNLSLPSGKQQYSGLQFSPDARYVSYARKGNLYLYPVDGGDELQITQGANEDKQPRWSPDGKMLLFLSRRLFGPDFDLCVVPIQGNKARGGVRVIKPDVGDDFSLCSLSNPGRLLYERSFEDRHIFWIAVDPQTGQPIAEPVKLASGTEPTWSPDGRQIAYIAEGVLHVMSADGSSDQQIMKVNFTRTGTYGWAPDNDHIYIPEWREKKIGIYVISLTTKERRDVLLSHENLKRIIEHLTCSPDGKRLAFVGETRSSKKLQVFSANVDGANVHQLTFDDTSNKYYPAWSPDGKHIAFEWAAKDGIRRLMVISADDRAIKEIFRGNSTKDRFYRKSWSPDGSKIAWATDDEPRVGQVSSGKYSTFKTGFDGSGSPCWSSDGTKMLFSTWVNVEQLTIMDNFLPELDDRQ